MGKKNDGKVYDHTTDYILGILRVFFFKQTQVNSELMIAFCKKAHMNYSIMQVYFYNGI
jgi:hypothetical protein